MRTGTWRVGVVLAVIVVLTATGGLGPWSPGLLLRMAGSYLLHLVLIGLPLFLLVRAAIISAARAIDGTPPASERAEPVSVSSR